MRAPLIAPALLAATLLLASGCADQPAPVPPDPTVAATTPSATAPSDHVTPSGPTDAAEEDVTLCGVFRQFADAQSQYVATPNADTTRELVTTGLALAALPRPADMDAGAYASLIELVRGTLAPAVRPKDLPPSVGAPDEASFSAYLDLECPA